MFPGYPIHYIGSTRVCLPTPLLPTQHLSREPEHPANSPEFFIRSLRVDERRTNSDIKIAGPGANIPVLIKAHAVRFGARISFEFSLTENLQEVCPVASGKSPTYALVVCVETPLPKGGIYIIWLDCWEEDEPGPSPLWGVDMSLDPAHPLRFPCTLGWLFIVISTIEARPARRDGDVWWRFLRFINNVKVRNNNVRSSSTHGLVTGGVSLHPPFANPQWLRHLSSPLLNHDHAHAHAHAHAAA